MKSKVYFTKKITSESLVRIYEKLNKELKGNVAVKISTGEPGGHNFLNPNLIKELVFKLNGTIVECNTAYNGRRNTTKEHLEAIREHGFDKIANIDIMDSDGEIEIPVSSGKHLNVNYVGKNISNYNSILVLSHFKGHAMGGYGGALKNLSIGIASRNGKAWIHTAGKTNSVEELWSNLPEQNDFLESMAEASESVINFMNKELVYINVMNNLSIDCDCDSNPEKPCMNDIGILASLDPVALDKACLDLIYSSNDIGKENLIKRIESKNGSHIIEYAESVGIGMSEYELINIDEEDM